MGLFSKKTKEVKSELFTVEHKHQIKEQQGNTSRVNPAIHQEQHVPSTYYSGATHNSPSGFSGTTEYFPSVPQGNMEIVSFRDPLDGILKYAVKDVLDREPYGTYARAGSSGISGSGGRAGSSGMSGSSGTSGIERPWWLNNREFRESLRSHYQIDDELYNGDNLTHIDIDSLYEKRREFPFGSGLDRQLNEQQFDRMKKLMKKIK